MSQKKRVERLENHTFSKRVEFVTCDYPPGDERDSYLQAERARLGMREDDVLCVFTDAFTGGKWGTGQ